MIRTKVCESCGEERRLTDYPKISKHRLDECRSCCQEDAEEPDKDKPGGPARRDYININYKHCRRCGMIVVGDVNGSVPEPFDDHGSPPAPYWLETHEAPVFMLKEDWYAYDELLYPEGSLTVCGLCAVELDLAPDPDVPTYRDLSEERDRIE